MESERNNNQKQEWSKPELMTIMMAATESGTVSSPVEWALNYHPFS